MNNNDMVKRITSKNGKILREECLNDKGELHSYEDHPAVTIYNEDGSLDSQIWYKNGSILRNKDDPSFISYYPGDGSVKVKTWNWEVGYRTSERAEKYNREGIKTMESNPHKQSSVVTLWSDDGVIRSKTTYLDGLANGKVQYMDGKVHHVIDERGYIYLSMGKRLYLKMKNHDLYELPWELFSQTWVDDSDKSFIASLN